MNKWMIAVLIATLSLSVAAQQDELEDLPGYVEFGELASFYGEPTVMINIGGVLLNFMSAASKDESAGRAGWVAPSASLHPVWKPRTASIPRGSRSAPGSRATALSLLVSCCLEGSRATTSGC